MYEQRIHQAVLLHRRNEAYWWNFPDTGLDPSRQHFEPLDSIVSKIDQTLKCGRDGLSRQGIK